MKGKTKAHRGLHVVTTKEASMITQPETTTTTQPESSPGSQQEIDSLIANGVRRYRELQTELDGELFGAQDHDKLAVLFRQVHLLRERLASHGVHVV